MKSKFNIFTILILAILFGCDNESLTDELEEGTTTETENTNSYRIKEILVNQDNFPNRKSKVNFSYSENKLSEIMTYKADQNGNWFEAIKREISYDENKSESIYYKMQNGIWLAWQKDNLVFENKKLIEKTRSIFINQEWKNPKKTKYTYNGDILSSMNEQTNYSGIISEYINDFTIEDNKIITSIFKHKNTNKELEELQKDLYEYSENNLLSISTLSKTKNGWLNHGKSEYTYSDDKITSCKIYQFDELKNDLTIYKTQNFTHNEFGYIKEIKSTLGESLTYTYEEGEGNAHHFWYTPEDFINNKAYFFK